MLLHQDHSEICKFGTKLGAYFTASSALNQVFSEVTGKLEPEQGEERRGIAGIGVRNSTKLEDALATVCHSIGFDMIENPNLNWERWRRAETHDRIQIFVDWLGKDFNKD
ncbi:hypothetical protein N0V84_004943 [Fusarium piperis]|uniref:Uncharacterized protein n=1 Tax=Fusarium piperis TaxID=1435070 RepID=A0A9W9BPF4_9HYPO|nr:hypothetical protein N0V84_004943 [Fusarium piperis]